jgi:CBS domain-containing protein
MKTARVAEIMTRNVEVIRRDRDVQELERLLLEKKIHGVPVVDDDGRLVGVVSQTDLLAWHHMAGVDGATFYDYTNLLLPGEGDFQGLRLSDVRAATVGKIMSSLTHSIGPDEALGTAAAMMVKRQVHRLIVVDDERRVLGVVSAIDLLRAVPGADSALQQP